MILSLNAAILEKLNCVIWLMILVSLSVPLHCHGLSVYHSLLFFWPSRKQKLRSPHGAHLLLVIVDGFSYHVIWLQSGNYCFDLISEFAWLPYIVYIQCKIINTNKNNDKKKVIEVKKKKKSDKKDKNETKRELKREHANVLRWLLECWYWLNSKHRNIVIAL